MKKTIFVTGASPGIGRAVAELFATKGWQVAKTIWRAATSSCKKMRYPSSAQGKIRLFIRKIIPVRWFLFVIRSTVEKGYKKDK